MSAAPAMAHETGGDRGRIERHERVDEFRHERVFVDRDVRERAWVSARYDLRSYDDCGQVVTERVCVEPGHWVIR